MELWKEKERYLSTKHERYYADPTEMWVDPFRIIGNVYFIGDAIVAPYLIDTGDGLIIVDTGYPHARKTFLKSISMLGYRPEDISYILHSHEHFDHFGSTKYLQETYGCKAYIHTAGAEVMRNRPELTHIQEEAELFIPDVKFSDQDTIELGNTKITCLHTPGHAAGASTFLFDVEEQGQTYHAGICGIGGNVVLHAGNLIRTGVSFSVRDDYLKSIEKLRDMPVDITLDPHPRPNGVLDRGKLLKNDPEENPFIDAAAWNANLEGYEKRFEELMQEEAVELTD